MIDYVELIKIVHDELKSIIKKFVENKDIDITSRSLNNKLIKLIYTL